MDAEQAKAALKVTMAVADAIKELGTVPAGELYAQVMGHMSLDGFNSLINLLTRGETPLVRREGDLLVWNG